MLSAYIVRKSEGKYQEAAEAARGSWARPLGVRVQKVQRVQRVQRVVVAANAAVFIGCFAAVVGALKFGRAPLMIKPENRAFGARGKHTNQAAPVGNAPPLARFAGLLLKGSVSLDSQSPKGSLRIQFPCHPASGSRTTRA